jgi:hypothetical protein
VLAVPSHIGLGGLWVQGKLLDRVVMGMAMRRRQIHGNGAGFAVSGGAARLGRERELIFYLRLLFTLPMGFDARWPWFPRGRPGRRRCCRGAQDAVARRARDTGRQMLVGVGARAGASAAAGACQIRSPDRRGRSCGGVRGPW